MKHLALHILLLLFPLMAVAQSDCVDAIIVCGSNNYTGLSATGVGVQELDMATNPCGSEEHNSIWFKILIKDGGTLGLMLTPESEDLVVDFDFWIYGPTATCANLGVTTRCSTTNPSAANIDTNITGMNDQETDLYEGPGWMGNAFINWMTVQDDEIYYLVVDRPHGQANFSLQWTGTATFHEVPYFNNPDNISLNINECDGDGVNDLKFAFDLTKHAAMLIGPQTDVALTYHENLNDVTNGINAITATNSYINNSNPQTLYMRMTNTATGCFSIEEFNIEVVDLLTAGDPVDLALCDSNENGLQLFNLSVNDYLVKGGNADTEVKYYGSQQDAENDINPLPFLYENEQPYVSQTIWARLDKVAGCFGSDITSFNISIIPLPEFDYTIDIVDFTVDANSIAVNIRNAENFEFSLDGENYRNTPYFGNLLPGPYTVFIRSKDDCKMITHDVLILNYPKFFTPNGDGINETWTLPYLYLIPEATVKIFDRYGKLITGFMGNSKGWDGNYNGHALPSTDYWFVLELQNGRIIRDHFAMIR